jgi:hypothetical protein
MAIKYEIYVGDTLLMVTDSYTIASRHAKAGKRVVAVNT